MLIDLQLHSTYSDGYLTPTAAAKYIAKQGVKVAALTDHNTVGGIDEFRNACKELEIKPITGLELYIKLHSHRFSLLWYNFDETDSELHTVLRNSQMRRRRQMRLVLEKLVDHGFKINIEKILDKYNHYVPVNHVLDDILKTSYNLRKIKRETGIKRPSEGEILGEYFHNRDIAVLKNAFIDFDTVRMLKKRIGGQLVLCHPAKHGYTGRNYLKDLKLMGLDGIEVLSPHHSYGAIIHLQRLAREINLIETGGSDFHRLEGGKNPVQNSWQYYQIDSRLLNRIKEII